MAKHARTPARRILVVTYYYPPDTSIGGRRWHAMARALREFGHDVTILTTAAWGSDQNDGAKVARTRDLAANRALRRLSGRPELPGPRSSPSVQKKAPGWLANGLVPDGYLASWVPGAAIAARRIVRERRVNCVVTSGPPQSVHIVGLLLGKDRPAWIADFRDGWSFEPPRPEWPTRMQKRIDAWLESRVINAAHVAVGVTKPIAEDLGARLGATAAVVPNGWDPIDGTPSSSSTITLDRSLVNVIHTGLLSAEGGRDPSAVLGAMWDLHASADPMAAKIRLILAGRLSTTDMDILAGAPPNVIHVGHLTPIQTFALQREANALLLLTAVGRRSEATGKLFEYLNSGRPIVALARDNEAARIVSETGTGLVAPPDNRVAIADALMAVADGRLDATYKPNGLERYRYPGPAREFAEQIDRAIALADRTGASSVKHSNRSPNRDPAATTSGRPHDD